MHPRDKSQRIGLVCVAALVALSPFVREARAESGTEESELHEVRITSPGGYRRIIVGDDRGEPLVVRSAMVRRARLGISLLDITPELRRHFGVPDPDTGVVVSRVSEGSPAEAAGIEVGDVIVAVDAVPISHAHHLAAEIASGEAGSMVQLEGWRQGRPVTFRAELEEIPLAQFDVTPLLFHGAHLRGPEDRDPEDEIDRPGVANPERTLELDGQVLTQALRHLEHEIGSGRLDHHFEGMRQDCGGLLQRLEKLERRLVELEVEIEELPPAED